ncbi:LPD25 domain-containing protein [Clostridioides difficile]|uniref:LPD25 domain-containing protein n=1 Tax=Clostridioides difficile TaxID=1496 RepID=UPI0027D95B51|nr:LPD25 domain-containing protein [Clostridioides difficile]
MIAKAEDEKASAFAISKEDIDSVLQKGSGVADGKYRIYRQFQKGVDRQKNIEFLKNEYGTGGGTHIFPDGFSGHSWYDSKGLAIDRNGTYTNHDLVLKWSQVEKRLRELIKDNRYLNPKEKDHYADYLESVSAPQYEIDTQRKIARQRFIDAHRDLPPADKRDTLALRLSDFIRDLDRYEKDLLSVVERSDLADVTAEQMEQHLSDPSTVQQLIDFLAQVQWKTTSVFSRSNGWKFTEELRELHPLCYLYNEGDVVYIGADKYEIATLTEEKVYLQNAEFPILGQEYSRADFEKKLTENPANDHLKVVVTEKQRTEAPSEKKQDGIQFSIGFSEHPAFYDRQLNDRYTDLSFALGNKLLGILDEKQHREREGDKNIGWYHKTDFVIKAVIGGEEFNYEGRFDIGDGEGDLIAHIKNFYDYALSPKGEQLYGDDRESLLRGRDEFIPFLEQHTELTQEDEKLLDEIMATESDWYRTAEEAEEKPQAYADIMNGSEAPAIEMEQSADDLIGREIIIDNRKYLIENIGKISGDVSLRDITFQNNVGFPINRVEKIGYIQKLLEQEKTELPLKEKTEAPAADRHNFRITDDAIGVGGAKEKFRNNMAAINLLHELEIENRLATPEEQEVLSRYVGWGGLSMAFDEHNAAWAEEFKELYASLSPEEYRAAMESTLTAFYTPPVVIKAMYDALDRLGFSQGNILEPSCGTGNFFGLLPESMQNSKLHGVEIDSLTGRIAKQLYQKANIAIEGFEKTNLPDDHFDVVLGNVPFGEIRVNDSRYNAQKFLIHDYFFAKALDKVRAGGVVMFITSKGTMDKASPEVRKYIAQRAELLGAIRLPDNTFKANAGTEVTSDILILQKRDRVMDIEPDWIHLGMDENGVTMNRYFVEHPEMVLGEIKMESTRFGTFELVCKARKDIPLSELLSNAVQKINGEIPELDNGVDEISDEQELSVPADPNVRNFSFTLVDGRVYFRENDRMHPASVSMTAENRIKGLIQIRDCVRKLIEYQTEDYPEEMICTEQENINRLYDAYTAKYGLINSRGNYLAFASDESYFLLCSLEVLDDEGNFKRKADMFTKRTIKPHREVTSVETASEALALSIGEKARVDLPYMEQLTGKTQAELVQDLQGVIFKVPNCEPVSYVAADEYLSGNVRNKLTVAELAAKNDPELAVNVDALKKVIPKDLSAAEISVRLGATWIPQEDIQRFVMELLTPSSYAAGRLKVRYTPINGDWFIENKSSDMGNVKADSTYGTKRASAYRIIEDTLNLRDTRIFDYVYDEHGNKKAVFNAKETTAAQAKQEAIKQAFQDWIWKDPERRNRLVRYYNDTFNSVRPREYDGSHITFGGISPEITLRPHQVNAIAHILYGGNTLLAHKVGAGKTFEMVAAAQESKRLGLCQKSMFVVPNHLVGQWASEYLRLYPSANILVTTKRDFETGNRKKFCGRIATGDYDAVIIGHSQFEKIPMSIERQREQLEKQLDDIERGIDDVQASKGEQFTVKQLMKTRKAIKTKLEKLNDTKRKDTVIDFEQLGVDRLFIDESHFYKNLYLYTKMRNVGGIAQTEAQKSSDLFMKCRYLDEITGNRGTVFATGTPVSNSMVELYSVQRYLQYDTLAQNGLQHFDSWASTFGETVTALELAPEGTNYRAKTRFAKFYNLPELMQMFREVADIQTADMLKLPVPKVNYHNIKTKPSKIQTEMVASLAKRAEKVRARLVEPNIDNMLKITNDGRKLALDQRMIDPMLPDDPESKVNACVDNVYRIWEEHADTKATQLVFCDLSTPKNDGTFNVYDDMREKLIARGIPAEQIRFIHEATTDAQKKELFGKVRSGEVRVLFGSTPKMGAGTNVQDRLIAIHNLDCPWRPSDLEQRQGRIERQGNMFPEVEVYRYVTEQTFDAYLYQLVESKQKFISQIMTSKSPVRSAEDVDEVALSFAEVKMLATGDERFKEKMDLDIQVSKLRVLKQSYLSEHYDLEDRVLKYYPQTIKEYEERIAGYESDAALAEQHKPQGEDKFCPMTLKGVTYTEKAAAGEMLLAICKEYPLSAPTEIGSYRGFRMEIYYDTVNAHYCMNLCGKAKHKVDLGADALGNLTRIENELSKFPVRLEAAKTKKAETIAQLEIAKEEIKKPFAFEDELKEKAERLNALNIELNLNEKDTSVMDTEPEQTEEQPERKCASRER